MAFRARSPGLQQISTHARLFPTRQPVVSASSLPDYQYSGVYTGTSILCQADCGERIMALRGNRALVAVVVVVAQMAVFCFFGAMSIIIPLIASEV